MIVISDDSNVSRDEKIPVKIEGLPVTMTFYSGASFNVIGRNVWEYLKANLRLHVCRLRLQRSCNHMVVITHYKLQACLLQKCLLKRKC